MFPIQSLNGQERHDYILKTFILNKAASQNKKYKRDIDVIRENHKFLWEDEDEPDTWETQLAKKYYDKLFKEYCIADLSRYKENKRHFACRRTTSKQIGENSAPAVTSIGPYHKFSLMTENISKIALRWRTEQEVVSGKGQFICGHRKCISKEGLRSWEVNFGYMEQGIKMNALIKLRLCPDCSKMLNYISQKREVKKQKRLSKSKKKSSKRKTNIKDDETGDESNTEGQQTGLPAPAECNLPSTSNVPQDDSYPESSDCTEEENMNIWSKPEVEIETVEREEEFEKYLEDLLL